MMEVWFVGEFISTHSEKATSWDLVGIFDSKDKALDACRTDMHFLAPAVINEDWGDEHVPFPDMEYPKRTA